MLIVFLILWGCGIVFLVWFYKSLGWMFYEFIKYEMLKVKEFLLLKMKCFEVLVLRLVISRFLLR